MATFKDLPATKTALDTFAKNTIKFARANLTRQDHNVSSSLYKSFSFQTQAFPNSLSVKINFEQYGEYLDKGVKGSRSSFKAPTSPYKYTTKAPPFKAIEQWVKARRFQFRDPKGRFISFASTAYLIQRSIFLTGTPTTNFFTRPFTKQLERLEQTLGVEVAKDVDSFLQSVIDGNNN